MPNQPRTTGQPESGAVDFYFLWGNLRLKSF